MSDREVVPSVSAHRTHRARRRALRRRHPVLRRRVGVRAGRGLTGDDNDGRPKRWVVVRPRGGQTAVLLARADGDQQAAVVGQQFAGRVGLFLRVDDFERSYQRMIAAGVRFVSPPRDEPYGRVAVFLDLEGNRWDLLGPF